MDSRVRGNDKWEIQCDEAKQRTIRVENGITIS
jgi:hypothetical protein